jgi:hypothetical protein
MLLIKVTCILKLPIFHGAKICFLWPLIFNLHTICELNSVPVAFSYCVVLKSLYEGSSSQQSLDQRPAPSGGERMSLLAECGAV